MRPLATMPGCVAIVVGAWISGLHPAADDDAKSRAFLDAAAEACPAILMRPDTASATLVQLGFNEKAAGALSATWITRSYQRMGPGTAATVVVVSSKTFTDATLRSCQMTMTIDPQDVDLAAIRARLEADPEIGRLEGDLAVTLPQLLGRTNDGAAFLKRPGSSPILTVHITKTPRMSIVVMSRTDLKPSH